MTDQQNNDAALPDDLIRALRSADRAPALITSRVDQALDRLAVAQFAGRNTRRRTVWYAAAASVLAVAMALQLQTPQQDLLYTDVDGSGQINIADVMALALLEDSRYTQEDLDAFAMRVVSLEDGS